MSDFNVPGSRPKKNTMRFRKSTAMLDKWVPLNARELPDAQAARPVAYVYIYIYICIDTSYIIVSPYLSLSLYNIYTYIYIYIYICIERVAAGAEPAARAGAAILGILGGIDIIK